MSKLNIRLILVKPENDFSLFRRENGCNVCNKNVHEKEVPIQKEIYFTINVLRTVKVSIIIFFCTLTFGHRKLRIDIAKCFASQNTIISMKLSSRYNEKSSFLRIIALNVLTVILKHVAPFRCNHVLFYTDRLLNVGLIF